MPIQEMTRLNKGSSDEQVKAAISSCIATEIRSGREKDQAAAICYSMARDRTGKELGQGGGGGKATMSPEMSSSEMMTKEMTGMMGSKGMM